MSSWKSFFVFSWKCSFSSHSSWWPFSCACFSRISYTWLHACGLVCMFVSLLAYCFFLMHFFHHDTAERSFLVTVRGTMCVPLHTYKCLKWMCLSVCWLYGMVGRSVDFLKLTHIPNHSFKIIWWLRHYYIFLYFFRDNVLSINKHFYFDPERSYCVPK